MELENPQIQLEEQSVQTDLDKVHYQSLSLKSKYNVKDTVNLSSLRKIAQPPLTLPWIYLIVLTLAEIFTNLINFQIGLILHAGLLVWLVIHGANGKNDGERKLALALIVGPLIRLLSFSLPINDMPQILWYPTVAIPLLMATFLIIRQLKLSRRAIGLRPGKIIIQFMLAFGGFGLGAIEYTILSPSPLINNLSWEALIIPALILLIFTGFNEEIVFRGLLQATALPLLRRWGLVYVALIFAVLHIGYKSILDVVFVFGVGLIFSFVVLWGGSILGVTLAHGLTNTMLFLVMPYLRQSQNGSEQAANMVFWLTIVGTVLALIAILILLRQALRKKALLEPVLEEQVSDQEAVTI